MTLKFKTNINCSGCIRAVTPFLDGADYVESWKVDLESPDRVLSVETDAEPGKIGELLKQAGYKAEPIS